MTTMSYVVTSPINPIPTFYSNEQNAESQPTFFLEWEFH